MKSKISRSDLLVSHAGCMDGAGCAVLFLAAGGLLENIHWVSPGRVRKSLEGKPGVLDGTSRIIMADVAPRDDEEANFFEKRGNVIVLDHHKSSQFLSGRPWCEIDMGRCGSKIFFDWLKDGYLFQWKKLIAAIDDHDRWLNLDPKGDELGIFMKTVGSDAFVKRFSEYPGVDWQPAEQFAIDANLERRRGYISKMCKRVKRLEIDGIKLGVVFASEHVSYLGHQILLENPDVQIAAMVDFSSMYVSLRSRGDVDCSTFAARRGGGGHAAASAFGFDSAQTEDFVSEIFS